VEGIASQANPDRQQEPPALNRVCSIFYQLTELFPRSEFRRAVEAHRAERHARGFSCWAQFLAMLFCQLAQAQSLREISNGLACSEGKLRHLGLESAPKRSTLAYANQHRPWQLYQTLFEQLYEKCRSEFDQARRQGRLRGRRFRFRNPLVSLDASIIYLVEKAFDWADYHRGKGAIKLHLALDHQGFLPRLAVISQANEPEVNVARRWKFPRGTVLLCDKGYVDYRWYDRLTAEGVFFVTRERSKAAVEVLERRKPVGERVLADEVIRLGAQRNRMKAPLRRIVLEPPSADRPITLLTNHFEWDAETVAELYRQRWEIEQFFRTLKQNLRVKTFVGTSANAVLIQVWTALIALLLLRFMMLRAQYHWSLSNLIALLRMQLFVYRDLWEWLNEPFRPPPPLAPAAEQLSFAWP